MEKSQHDYDLYEFFHWYDQFQRPCYLTTNPKRKRKENEIFQQVSTTAILTMMKLTAVTIKVFAMMQKYLLLTTLESQNRNAPNKNS